MTTHHHHLAKGQWICDNNECREKIFRQVEQINNELKTDFDRVVHENSTTNKIDEKQAWKIIRFMSEKLSMKLALILNNEQIRSIIDDYAENRTTQAAFRQAFHFKRDEHRSKKKQEQTEAIISNDQLWNIYQRICRDAIAILSKTPSERKTHVSNFLVFDQNTSS